MSLTIFRGNNKQGAKDNKVHDENAQPAESTKCLENVRDSNLAYNQLLVGEYLTLFFALIGVGSAIIA